MSGLSAGGDATAVARVGEVLGRGVYMNGKRCWPAKRGELVWPVTYPAESSSGGGGTLVPGTIVAVGDRKAYVNPLRPNGGITVVDLYTGEAKFIVVDTLPPAGTKLATITSLTWDPQRDVVYASSPQSCVVFVIDPATDTVVDTITTLPVIEVLKYATYYPLRVNSHNGYLHIACGTQVSTLDPDYPIKNGPVEILTLDPEAGYAPVATPVTSASGKGTIEISPEGGWVVLGDDVGWIELYATDLRAPDLGLPPGPPVGLMHVKTSYIGANATKYMALQATPPGELYPSLWVAQEVDSTHTDILRINPFTGAVLNRWAVPLTGPHGSTAVWQLLFDTDDYATQNLLVLDATGLLCYIIDPRTLTVKSSIPTREDTLPINIALYDNNEWAVSYDLFGGSTIIFAGPDAGGTGKAGEPIAVMEEVVDWVPPEPPENPEHPLNYVQQQLLAADSKEGEE